MRKVCFLFSILSLLMMVGCSINEKNMSTNSSSNNTNRIHEQVIETISQQDYTSLTGEWQCLDDPARGEKVIITQEKTGLAIQYMGENTIKTQFAKKTTEKNNVYFRFENKDEQIAFMFVLKSSGNIILNRGTTNPDMTGLSKPMAYEKLVQK